MSAPADPLLAHLNLSAGELWVIVDSVAGASRVLTGLYGREVVWWSSGRLIREPVSAVETHQIRDLLDAMWLIPGELRDYDYHRAVFPARPVLLTRRARHWALTHNPHWWARHPPAAHPEGRDHT